jgi:hypothetical protein
MYTYLCTYKYTHIYMKRDPGPTTTPPSYELYVYMYLRINVCVYEHKCVYLFVDRCVYIYLSTATGDPGPPGPATTPTGTYKFVHVYKYIYKHIQMCEYRHVCICVYRYIIFTHNIYSR